MNLNYSLGSILASVVIGLVLILWPDVAVNYLVISIGIVLFMLPGLLALAHYFISKKIRGKHWLLLALGSLFFGLFLVIKPDFFADILMILLGLVLILEGMQQLVVLFRIRRTFHLPISYYHAILPFLVLGVGVFALFSPSQTRDTVLIVVGSANLFYAFYEVYLWLKYKRSRQSYNNITDAELIEDK